MFVCWTLNVNEYDCIYTMEQISYRSKNDELEVMDYSD